jgi:hypothetical protein
MALTRTTSSGGEDPGASGSWAVIEAAEAMLEEALSPHADDFAPGGEAVRDQIVRQPLMSQKDHLCPDDLIIRQRILVRSPLQLSLLFLG